MTPFVILAVLPFIFALNILEESRVPENYSFYEEVCILGECNVHLFIIDSWEDFPPEKCQDKSVRGCSVYGNNIDDYIYLTMPLYIDKWGMNSFEHEIAHIRCECNFHLTVDLREALMDRQDVMNFIIDNKEEIKKYLRSFI